MLSPTRLRVISHSRPTMGANLSWALVLTDMAPPRTPQNHESTKRASTSCAAAVDGLTAPTDIAAMASAKPSDFVRLVHMKGDTLRVVTRRRELRAACGGRAPSARLPHVDERRFRSVTGGGRKV